MWIGECKHFRLEFLMFTEKLTSSPKFDRSEVVLTTYTNMTMCLKHLQDIFWWRLVVDEPLIHPLPKNIHKLHRIHSWYVSAHPIGNDIYDLMDIFQFLKIPPYDDVDVSTLETLVLKEFERKSSKGIQRLRCVLSNSVLCVNTWQVAEELMLPRIEYQIKTVQLSLEERIAYESCKRECVTALENCFENEKNGMKPDVDARIAAIYNSETSIFYSETRQAIRRSTSIQPSDAEVADLHLTDVVLKRNISSKIVLNTLTDLRVLCCHTSLVHSVALPCEETGFWRLPFTDIVHIHRQRVEPVYREKSLAFLRRLNKAIDKLDSVGDKVKSKAMHLLGIKCIRLHDSSQSMLHPEIHKMYGSYVAITGETGHTSTLEISKKVSEMIAWGKSLEPTRPSKTPALNSLYSEYERLLNYEVILKQMKSLLMADYNVLSEKKSCIICLDDEVSQHVVLTPCGHFFCVECLDNARKTHDKDDTLTCAICRFAFNPKVVYEIAEMSGEIAHNGSKICRLVELIEPLAHNAQVLHM